MMEERMMDVEQKLRLVKRLLQDKVNQLKEQVSDVTLLLKLSPLLLHATKRAKAAEPLLRLSLSFQCSWADVQRVCSQLP